MAFGFILPQKIVFGVVLVSSLTEKTESAKSVICYKPCKTSDKIYNSVVKTLSLSLLKSSGEFPLLQTLGKFRKEASNLWSCPDLCRSMHI